MSQRLRHLRASVESSSGSEPLRAPLEIAAASQLGRRVDGDRSGLFDATVCSCRD